MSLRKKVGPPDWAAQINSISKELHDLRLRVQELEKARAADDLRRRAFGEKAGS